MDALRVCFFHTLTADTKCSWICPQESWEQRACPITSHPREQIPAWGTARGHSLGKQEGNNELQCQRRHYIPNPARHCASEALFSWETRVRLCWRIRDPLWAPSLCFSKTESCPGFTEPRSMAHKSQPMQEVMWWLGDLFTSSPPTIHWNKCINRTIWRTDSGGSPRAGNQHSALLECSYAGRLGPAECQD